MAKPQKGRTQEAKSPTNGPAIPAGYKRRASEVAGFWNPGSVPIHFIPREVRVVDSSIDDRKPSILIIGESIGVNDVITPDGEMVSANQGDLVGIWYKPGMKTIRDLCGVPVFLYESGEKDTGKPSKMKLYEVLSPKTGASLMVTGDFRKKSSRVELPFDIKGGARQEEVPEAYGDEQEA